MSDFICECEGCESPAVYADDFGNYLCEHHAEMEVEDGHSVWEDFELLEYFSKE